LKERAGEDVINPSNWDLPFAGVWLALYCIVLLRAGGTYAVGRFVRGGMTRFSGVRRTLDSERYRKAEARLNGWGPPVVALSFLTIGLQTLMNLAAGTTRMPLIRYLPALAIGGAAWATIYSTVGFIGFEALAFAYSRAPVLTVALVIAFLGLLAAMVFVKRRPSDSRASRAEASEDSPRTAE
jgi:membrane protein DedA with SNARE-associated domain